MTCDWIVEVAFCECCNACLGDHTLCIACMDNVIVRMHSAGMVHVCIPVPQAIKAIQCHDLSRGFVQSVQGEYNTRILILQLGNHGVR